MAQTPLHVAAGYNKVEIVKLLLNWKGQEKVELEAKNMYGETPLHMVAKNGCNEAAKLLLSHGAFVEAKANNGMPPLHLAVWHSLRSDDCLTVKTLLEYNADCSAKDDDGMTLMNHLSPGPGSVKLRQLLNEYLEEQIKRKAVEACSQTKAKMDELEQGLLSIVGLNELKLQLRKWARGMLLDERRRALGLKVAARRPPHMAFLGNPGTVHQWADCNLAGALGLLRILIYTTSSDGKTTMFVHEKQASIKEFYGMIFPSLLQLQKGITESEEGKQKELSSTRYRKYGPHERRELTKLEKELEEEWYMHGVERKGSTTKLMPLAVLQVLPRLINGQYPRNIAIEQQEAMPAFVNNPTSNPSANTVSTSQMQ